MSIELSASGSADTTAVLETAPVSNNNETNPGNMHPGANYFFGFLITFIVLLFIFIGCGLGSRRRMARRRAMFDAGPWAGLRPDLIQNEPVFWEPKLVKGGDMWSTIMPLSMVVLPPAGAETYSAMSPSSRSFSAFSFTSWIPRSRSAPDNKINAAGAVCEVPNEPIELQVAVIVALPSNRDPINEGSVTGPAECQFGVIHIPWEGSQPKSPSAS